MSMHSGIPEERDDDSPKSRFTYRDLRLLAQSSVTSPLRVIALVDFDCFYAQCESVRLGLSNDQPLGVQQFKHVIAINYPARAAGLKKVVTAIEAKQKCPNIVLQHVPTWREGDVTWAYRDDVHQHMDSDKSSLDYYRLQSRKAIEVVKNKLPKDPPQKIEKAGIDEVFLDLSAQIHSVLLKRYPELVTEDNESLDSLLCKPPTEVLDWYNDQVVGTDEADEDQRIPDWDDVALNIGAEIVRGLRAEIYKKSQYTCSAGIACNKVIAKLAAGHNKPNKQTVVRKSCIATFLSTYKFTKLRGMGGKLGAKVVKEWNTELISELLRVPLNEMQAKLDSSSGLWVHRVIRGIEHSEVVSRTIIKSMASEKTFTPKIEGLKQAEGWLRIFAADIMGRIDDQEGRRPRTIAVHHSINGRFGPTRSKQGRIPLGSKVDIECLFMLSRNILIDITREGVAWPCLCLSISVSDFFDTETTSHSLTSFWGPRSESLLNNAQITASTATRMQKPPPKAPRKRTIPDFQVSPPLVDYTQFGTDIEERWNTPTAKKQCGGIPATGNVKNAPFTNPPENVEEQYSCPTCRKLVSADEVLEHLDWHVALDLQNQT